MFAAGLLLLFAEPSVDPLIAEMQQLEQRRNAAIKAGDMAVLGEIYATDFHGIAGNGSRVDRPTLFTVFARNAGGDYKADSQILSAQREGDLAIVEGRLKLAKATNGELISDSHYLHIFRKKGNHWEMIEGASVPIPQASR